MIGSVALAPRAHAAYVYERSPSGTLIDAPVTISLNWSDFASDFGIGDSGYFLIGLYTAGLDIDIQSEVFDSSSGSSIAEFNLNPGDYVTSVYLLTCDDEFCTSDIDFIFLEGDDSETIFTIQESESGIGALITLGETGYETVTGENMSASVSFVKDNLILLWLGSGLSVLLALKYWIVALIIIAAITYFGYRSWRFFIKGT